jgi:geranylgeranyl reductase family protein
MVVMPGNRYDVVVVGGGPAGGTVAYELSRQGIRVLLLEKQKLPRYKVCAGGVTLKAAQLLDFDLSPAFEQEIVRGKCTFRCGTPVDIEFGEVVGWTVMRDRLDYLILEGAAGAGAQILDQQRVQQVEYSGDGALVRANGQQYGCSVVVGADGANGIVARSAGLLQQRQVAVAVGTELRVPDGELEKRTGCVHFDFGSIPGGYGWVFPKSRHLSVGAGTFIGQARNLKQALVSFLDALGVEYREQDIVIKGQPVPLGGQEGVFHRERLLLVGDAASLAEPMTGEGIYYAVKSGQIAAKTIGRALGSSAIHLAPYTTRVNQEITQDLKYARRLASLLYRFPGLCFRFFVRSTQVQKGVTDVLYGRSTYSSLYRDLLRDWARILLDGLP